jgi:septum formation protein
MLVLASTSPYRKALLERLHIPFEQRAPVCDEEAFKKKVSDPFLLCSQLAIEKAHSLATPKTITIGSDQVLCLENQIFGKPHHLDKAQSQLHQLSGKKHQLLTSTAVFKGHQLFHHWVTVAEMHMKFLTPEQIHNYLQLDQPFDCAGSYKLEKRGIALFSKIECEDWTSIEGLPLVALSKVLDKLGIIGFSNSNG